MSRFTSSFLVEFGRRFNPEALAGAAVSGVKILIIFLVAFLCVKILDKSVSRWENRYLQREGSQRVFTLGRVLQSLIKYIIYFIAVVMVLQELHVNTASILASAGIVGVAVGFGAQSLVRDVISGFFILLENQYAVGDLITIGGDTGIVEDITMRLTRIKGDSGEIYTIPNGQIARVVNHSRASRRARVDVGVPYDVDVEEVQRVLEDVAAGLKRDIPEIVEGPTVLGITQFADPGPVFTMVAFTQPGAQWMLEREMRKRIKLRFDQAGIRHPLPSRMIINRGEITGGAQAVRAGGHSEDEEKTPLRQ